MIGEICRIPFQRHDVLVDERAHAAADRFGFGREGEVHILYPFNCTTWPPSTTMVAPVM